MKSIAPKAPAPAGSVPLSAEDPGTAPAGEGKRSLPCRIWAIDLDPGAAEEDLRATRAALENFLSPPREEPLFPPGL